MPSTAKQAETIAYENARDALAAQIKALTDAVAKLAAAKENKVPNAGGTEGKKGHYENRRPQQTKLQNMGAYCSSHGFHPVGVNHDSATCSRRKPEHKSEATWGNRLGGSTFWPAAKNVAVVQHDHPTWKGKTALTT
jgi:hypothetical protein